MKTKYQFEIQRHDRFFYPSGCWARINIHLCIAFGLWVKWEGRQHTGYSTVFRVVDDSKHNISLWTSALIIALPFVRIDIIFPHIVYMGPHNYESSS